MFVRAGCEPSHGGWGHEGSASGSERRVPHTPHAARPRGTHPGAATHLTLSHRVCHCFMHAALPV